MQNKHYRLVNGAIVAVMICAATVWSTVACSADEPGVHPGDASMTCAQIAAELQPYMQQMMPSVTAMGQTTQEVQARSKARMKEAATESAKETAEARATAADPTGMASKIVGQQQVQRQKERWQRAEAEDKPLNDKYKAQVEQVAKQGQQLQSDARLQRLMQLAQEKNCQ